jgi:hypothetical protein
MQVESYDVYQITPKHGAVVFESQVAPTKVDGIPNTTGDATQSLVMDRSKFTALVKTDTITIKKMNGG